MLPILTVMALAGLMSQLSDFLMALVRPSSANESIAGVMLEAIKIFSLSFEG